MGGHVLQKDLLMGKYFLLKVMSYGGIDVSYRRTYLAGGMS